MVRFPSRAACAAAALGLAALLATAAHAQSSYTVTDLGTLNKGYQSYPYAINSSTSNILVVGRTIGASSDQGFFWSTSGGMVGLNGIDLHNGKTYRADPTGLNSHGDVVGQSIPNDSTSVNYRAFYWNPSRGAGNSLNLDPANTSTGSTANAINESGVIVGQANGRAVYWLPAGLPVAYTLPMTLNLPPNLANGVAVTADQINANGDILGSCADVNWIRYAVVWKNAGSPAAPSYGAPAVLGSGTHERVMNGVGQVVATVTGPGQSLFSPLIDGTYGAVSLSYLGVSSVQLWGLNDSGLMSGHAITLSGNQMRAAAWTPDGSIINLGTLGGTVSRAYSIHFKGLGQTLNSSGEGIGYSTLSSGVYHGLRWNLGTGIQDLNSSVLTPSKGIFSYLKDAACITDEGYITGSGILAKGGDEHAYLLTPKL